jgi:hypothetical protein
LKVCQGMIVLSMKLSIASHCFLLEACLKLASKEYGLFPKS